MKKICSDDVDDEPASGDQRHLRSGDLFGCAPPIDRFVDDPDRKQNERNAIDERGEDLEPVVAVGFFRCSGA